MTDEEAAIERLRENHKAYPCHDLGLTPVMVDALLAEIDRLQAHTPEPGWEVGVAHCDLCSMRPRPDPVVPVEWGRTSCPIGSCITVYRPLPAPFTPELRKMRESPATRSIDAAWEASKVAPSTPEATDG